MVVLWIICAIISFIEMFFLMGFKTWRYEVLKKIKIGNRDYYIPDLIGKIYAVTSLMTTVVAYIILICVCDACVADIVALSVAIACFLAGAVFEIIISFYSRNKFQKLLIEALEFLIKENPQIVDNMTKLIQRITTDFYPCSKSDLKWALRKYRKLHEKGDD